MKALLVCCALFCLSPAFGAPAPARMAAALQPFFEAGFFAGAVTLVASPEKVLSAEAVGWMDLAKKKPMRPDTVFWIASQSKPITAAALMILTDEGRISVDDPIAKYLPEFKDQWVKAEADETHRVLRRPRRPIQVRDLLTHTSGLPPYAPIEDPAVYDLLPLAIRVRSYAALPLETEPGEKYAYSNAGINTVGRIIEVVSGMPFEQFLDKRLLQPLGMKDTTFWPSGSRLERLAKSYKSSPGGLEECPIHMLRYPLDRRDRQAFPGGGLFSTAQDLALFYRMLANDGVLEGRRILSAVAVRQMTTDQSGQLKQGYGFGIATKRNTFGHGGAYSTNTLYDRDTRLIMIFLVQQVRWEKGGEKIVPAFQKAAAAAFGAASATAGAAKPRR